MESPKVIVTNRTAFGGASTESIPLQTNRPNPLQEGSEVFLYRLSIPARFEAMLADAVVWMSSPAFIASLLGHAIASGFMSIGVVGFGLMIVCLPIFLWALYLKSNCDGYEEITGTRFVMVLAGVLLGCLPFFLS